MSVPVEAQSLSSLQYLLANPPQYPRNPAHTIQKPLVLYIVRVPGSKDVFLTPLKPPTKASISLEAIQSSLYYLHASTPDDEEVRQSIDQEKATAQKENAVPTVHRKPVPNHETLSSAATLNLSETDNTATSRRAPTNSTLHQTHSSINPILRKPLGPRNPSNQLGREGKNNRTDTAHEDTYKATTELSAPRSEAAESGVSHTELLYPSNERSIDFQNTGQSTIRDLAANSPTKSVHERSSFTLIRRDPVSGSQWNVGIIREVYSSPGSALHPMSIELTAPGYGRFSPEQDSPSSSARPLSIASEAEYIKKLMAGHAPDGTAASDQLSQLMQVSETGHTFTRTVAFRQQHRPENALTNRPLPLQNRTNSSDSFLSHSLQSRTPRSVFSFKSPWQTLCVFANGVDGKSLKCRHMLPTSITKSGDSGPHEEAVSLAEVRFNLHWGGLLAPTSTATVSSHGRAHCDDNDHTTITDQHAEILPITTLLKDKHTAGGKESLRRGFNHIKQLSREIKNTHLRDRSASSIESVSHNEEHRPDHMSLPQRENQRQQQHHNQHNPTIPFQPPMITYGSHGNSTSARPIDPIHEHDHDGNRLSLKLGREKAGGGYRGHSAKLGKLILEDDGLKMGDLVVAACMGIWWQHYENSGLWTR